MEILEGIGKFCILGVAAVIALLLFRYLLSGKFRTLGKFLYYAVFLIIIALFLLGTIFGVTTLGMSGITILVSLFIFGLLAVLTLNFAECAFFNSEHEAPNSRLKYALLFLAIGFLTLCSFLYIIS